MPVVTLSPFDPVKTVATMLGSELQGCHFGCAASGGLGDVAAAAKTIPAFADELNAKRQAIKSQALSAFRRAQAADSKMKAAIVRQKNARSADQKKTAQYEQARAADEGQKATNDAVVLRARLERMDAAAKVAEAGKIAANKGESQKAVQLAADAEAILQTTVRLEVPVVKQPVISAELTRHAPNPAPRVKMALVGNPEAEAAMRIWEQTIAPEYLAARNAAWAEVKDIVGAKNPFNQGWTYDDEDWTTYGLAGIVDDLSEKSGSSVLAVRKALRERVGEPLGDLGIDILGAVKKAACAIPGGATACKAAKAATTVGKQCLACGYDVSDAQAGSGNNADVCSQVSATTNCNVLPAGPARDSCEKCKAQLVTVSPPSPDPTLPGATSDSSLPYCDEILSTETQWKTGLERAFAAWRPTHQSCPLCDEVTAPTGGPDGRPQTAQYVGSAFDGAAYVKGPDGLTCLQSWRAALKAEGLSDSCPSATLEGAFKKEKQTGYQGKCRPRGSAEPDASVPYDPTKPGGEGSKLSAGLVIGGLLGLGVIGYFVSR